jgi:hypothetical protein
VGSPWERFDFASSETPHVDPLRFRIDVATVATLGAGPGARLVATGFALPIGFAGLAEFRAERVTDRQLSGALWDVAWPRRGTDDRLAVDPGGLEIDLTAATRARMLDGFAGRDLGTVLPARIVPAAERGEWRVIRETSVTLHREFGNFALHLAQDLFGGGRVLSIRASGADDPALERLVATSVSVALR